MFEGRDGAKVPGFEAFHASTSHTSPLLYDIDLDGVADIVLATYDGEILFFKDTVRGLGWVALCCFVLCCVMLCDVCDLAGFGRSWRVSEGARHAAMRRAQDCRMPALVGRLLPSCWAPATEGAGLL